VVFLHGGPGGGSYPGARRLFDPARFDIIQLDQRGCGRSTPLASAPDADLSANTTAHLIGDLEALRQHLGLERWAVVGMSWGTTLGLAYAVAHPGRVLGLVLALVTTTSRREVRWITEDVGRIFPEAWDRFLQFVPPRLRHLPLVDAYAELLFDPHPATREAAALSWCLWEDAHVSLTPGPASTLAQREPAFRLGFARLVTHYWRHAAFLDDDQLLRQAPRLDGIPGALIHGRRDVSGPLETAWRLSRRWSGSRLIVLEDAGHGGGDGFMVALLGEIERLPRG
jgi:proline iminopeptidase